MEKYKQKNEHTTQYQLGNMESEVHVLSLVQLMSNSGGLNMCASKPTHRQNPNNFSNKAGNTTNKTQVSKCE